MLSLIIDPGIVNVSRAYRIFDEASSADLSQQDLPRSCLRWPSAAGANCISRLLARSKHGTDGAG